MVRRSLPQALSSLLVVAAFGCDTPSNGDGAQSDGTASDGGDADDGDDAANPTSADDGAPGLDEDGDSGAGSASATSGDPDAGTVEEGGDEDSDSGGPPTPECSDDDPDVSCYDGSPQTADVGLCESGVRSCVGGIWSDCIAQTLPSRESCNGDDDDCDGVADEECECLPDQTQECYAGPDDTAGVGLCVAGVQSCDAGVWSPCADEVLPARELCNGEDDNCDGEIDETCQCSPGDTQSCYSGPAGTEGVGTCSAGSQTCNADGNWDSCQDETAPVSEVCNAQDDDCDGEADELDDADDCDTGDDGICGAGVAVCIGGALTCAATNDPETETCDGLDNDCDGQIDEALTDDPILISGELPDAWSGTIPLVGSYPSVTAGLVPARLAPFDDIDWFSAFAEEQVFDVFGDTPVDGLVTITSPGPGFDYEVCACWSTTAALCGKNAGGAVPTCATSTDGTAANVTVQMAMIQGDTDNGYLDVSIRPAPGSATGCGLYTVQWQISEG